MNATAATDTAERIAESVWFRLLSRASMLATPFVFSLTGYLALQWLDGRMDQQVRTTVHATVAPLRAEIDGNNELTRRLSDRVLTLENNTTRGREDRERFQEQTMRQLEAINTSIGVLNATVAAMQATMEAERRARERPQR